MTSANEPEKVAVERATAGRFLKVYNQQHDTEFGINELGDSPDVRCIDGRTSDILNLEICVLEDIPGYARWRLGRGPKPTGRFGSSYRSFSEEVLSELRNRLRDKLTKRYGSKTALVIRQLSPCWDRDDWNRFLANLSWGELGYEPGTFDRGVWLLTLKDENGLSKDDILRIDPGFSTADS